MIILRRIDYISSLNNRLKKVNNNILRNNYINDNFNKSIHTTIKNIICMALFWIITIIPFFFVGRAVFIFHDGRTIHFIKYLAIFFGLWLIFFLISIPLLTLLNNHRTRYLYHTKITYNPKRLITRKKWLDDYYTIKFGTNLHHIKNYRVPKDDNIPVDYIIKQYPKLDKVEKQINSEKNLRK